MLFETSIDMRLFESVFFGWLYLRFFMVRELSELQGDQSTNFSFVSFFPVAMAEHMKPYVNKLYDESVRLGVINSNPTSSTGTMMDKTNVYDRQK